MITETGRIVAIEDDGLWVQTIRKSACAQCSAQKGCGQAVLAKLGREPGYIKVSLNGQAPTQYQLGDYVEIGIGEDVLVKSTLVIYLLPLVMLLVGVIATSKLVANEAMSLLGGILGLIIGGLITRKLLTSGNRQSALEPVLIGSAAKPEIWLSESLD